MFDDEFEWTTDYTDRCGNCHEFLEKKDKYCRKCGTKRGEGEFKPYQNIMYCVYGPPIKKKYKCSGCGFIWITRRLGGLGSANYCPQCGMRHPNLINESYIEYGDRVGTEEPYDPQDPPQLLTVKQLRYLLYQRDGKEHYTDDELAKRMRKAGITVPEYSDEEGDIRYYITEAEAERMNLAEKVLTLEGDDPNAFPGIKCSKCGSGYIAALTYTTLKNYQIDGTTMRAETESPLFLKTNHRIPGCESRNAFLCLQCGTEFELQLKENR